MEKKAGRKVPDKKPAKNEWPCGGPEITKCDPLNTGKSGENPRLQEDDWRRDSWNEVGVNPDDASWDVFEADGDLEPLPERGDFCEPREDLLG